MSIILADIDKYLLNFLELKDMLNLKKVNKYYYLLIKDYNYFKINKECVEKFYLLKKNSEEICKMWKLYILSEKDLDKKILIGSFYLDYFNLFKEKIFKLEKILNDVTSEEQNLNDNYFFHLFCNTISFSNKIDYIKFLYEIGNKIHFEWNKYNFNYELEYSIKQDNEFEVKYILENKKIFGDNFKKTKEDIFYAFSNYVGCLCYEIPKDKKHLYDKYINIFKYYNLLKE